LATQELGRSRRGYYVKGTGADITLKRSKRFGKLNREEWIKEGALLDEILGVMNEKIMGIR